jgi:hypothetical protein
MPYTEHMPVVSHRWLSRWCVWLGLTCSGMVTAWAGVSSDGPRFVPSKDGASLMDARTKLVWSRCVEGMHWNGKTCVGQPQRLTHSESSAQAKRRALAEGVPWRLPRVTELQRLASKSANASGLDAKLFPAAPDDWHWAMTASVRATPGAVNQYNYGNIAQGRTSANANQMDFLHGWAVNLQTGEARNDITKRTELPVRLVHVQE